MTFRVFYNNEALFLKIALDALKKMEKLDKQNLYDIAPCCATVIIACQVAVETFLNTLFLEGIVKFKHYEKLGIAEKIYTVYELNAQENKFSWGEEPFQTFGKMIKTRNHLVHYKNNRVIGLIGAEDTYVENGKHKIPKFKIETELSFIKGKKYYEKTIAIIFKLYNIFENKNPVLERIIKDIEKERYIYAG